MIRADFLFALTLYAAVLPTFKSSSTCRLIPAWRGEPPTNLLSRRFTYCASHRSKHPNRHDLADL